ncbi:MAG: HAD family hydrolase [Clostridia bacterium]|nr:HAD family hydrolase [Clostridia bacterium]
MAFKDITHIIWDWNGTLLDDAAYCLDLTDRLLRIFRLKPMETLENYRERFGFPVIDYYGHLGFDRQIFPEVAVIWMDAYMKNEKTIPLHLDAAEVTEKIRQLGIRQVIVSASKLENLLLQLASRPQFAHFDPPRGLGDIYAGSKKDIALKWMADTGADPERTLLVGDTLHDLEVARALGCGCILVENGHQSAPRLRAAGARTAANLTELFTLLRDGEAE